MKLEELFLDGFGHFHQRTFSPAEGPVTVFLGPNEAGKSTLLAFIRTVIFGFPRQGRDAHYPPLAGGRHGGRIHLSGDDGQAYTLERYAGTVAVRNDAGDPLDPTEFLSRITGRAAQAVFNNVFAFTIDELQQVGLLDDSSVNESIYSVGQGVPGLSAFGQRLTARRRDIFLPTGKAQEVIRLAGSLREVDGQLQAVAGNADRYGSLTTRRAGVETGLQALDEERSRSNTRQAENRNLISGWDDWVKLNNCDSQLEALPTYEQFPDDAIPRLEAFQERARQAGTDSEEAAEQLRVATEAAAAGIPDEALLEAAGRVEEIRRGRGSFDGSVHDLPERQGDLREMETSLSTGLAELGHQWKEADLEAFDASLVVRNHVDAWKERLTESGERLRRAELREDQERRALLDRQLETRESREQLPAEPPPLDAAELMERHDALRTARGNLGEYERLRQNHENLRGQLGVLASSTDSPHTTSRPLPPPALILLALAGAAMAVTGGLLGGQALPMGVVGGLILIAVAAALWFAGRSGSSRGPSPVTSPLGQQASDAESAVERSRQELIESAVPLGLTGQPDGGALDSVEARLEAVRTQIGTWDFANAKLKEASRRHGSQEQRRADALQDQEVAAAAAQEAQQEWRQWLRDRQLDEALTPEGMTVLLVRIDTVMGILTETRRMRVRVAAIKEDIEEFRQKVEPLAAAHAIPFARDNWGQVASAADVLIDRLNQAGEAQSRRDTALEQQEATRRLVDGREQRVTTAQQELDGFLALGGTNDPEDFRLRARSHEARLELQRQRNELARRLELLSGPGDSFNAFREHLVGTDQIQLNEESARVAEQAREVEERRSSLQEERGRIDHELEQLTGEEESSLLRSQRETLLEQLRDSAREWSRLTLAEALLEKTRQKFEIERQPRVVQHAQDFFSHITGQRYTRLFVPIGERTVTVMDGTGGTKRPQDLSRGTKEQLYLALRFGLVREFGEHAERLPVVVDEVLVNFDPDRARLAAEAFATLSETNQVLVFTCHPGTADLFADAAGAQVIEVESTVGTHV